MRTLLDQVVHPMPTKGDVDSALPEMRKQNFGKIPLECIMLALPMKERDIQPIPLGLFPTYCFDPGKDSLRVSFNFGSEYVVRNAIGKFQGQTVATDVMVNESSLHAGSAKVVTLETSTQPIDTTIDEPDTEPVNTARVAGGVMAGSILSKQPPEYPAGARQRHVSGTVVLHAIIGRDGHVYSLHFVSLPDPRAGHCRNRSGASLDL